MRDVPIRLLVDSNLDPFTTGNPFPVFSGSAGAIVDDANSFDDREFAPNEEFIGPWTDSLAYSIVTFLVDTDQNSATNGAVVEYSDNGTDIERVLDATVLGTAVGGQPLSFALPPQSKYFRVRYINGGIAATVNLQTILRPSALSAASVPLASEITPFDSAGLVRAVLAGQQSSGAMANLSVDNNGFLRINFAQQDIALDIASLTMFDTAQASIGTSALQVGATGLSSPKSISFKAFAANTARIYLGPTSAVATGNGWPLEPGEPIDLEIDDTTPFWAISTEADQRLAWIAVGSA